MARVAIEYTPAVMQGGGVGRSVAEMTSALLAAGGHNYTLFVAGSAPVPPDVTAYMPRIARAPLSNLMLTRLWHRLHIPLPVETFTGRQDLYFATDFALPPTLPRTRTAVFIHDLTYIRVPDAAMPPLVAYLSAAVPRAISRASVVIVNSEATKADLLDVYKMPLEKISTVQFGVHSRFAPTETPLAALRAKYNLPDSPYIFTVGTLQPRKNYARLVSALARLRRSNLDVTLVIAGGKGWLDSPLYAHVRALNLESAVTFIGYADDADLPALYTHAAAFAMPSLYEGFGLPVLEAMACGTPVVTSDVSSLPEAAGDAALLVDPRDEEALADALARILTDPLLRADLTARGLRRAAEFTWARTAQQLQVAFDMALRG